MPSTDLTSIARPAGAALLAAVAGLASCSAPQRSLTDGALLAAQQDFLDRYAHDLLNMRQRSDARIEREYRAALSEPDAPPQSHDILVLSGGGPYGAFGAGFLQGWGEIEDPEHRRPHFDAVSGISTGAVIAPFAFEGSPSAYQRIVDLYRHPDASWASENGLLPWLPHKRSLLETSDLYAAIRGTVTPETIEALRRGGEQDRLLQVGATHLDYGRMRVFDLAQVAGEDDALERVRRIVLASAAIPGAFPPVEFDGGLWVDGGTSMQIVGALDDRGWASAPEGRQLPFVEPGRPVRIRVWVIVNQKLLPDPVVSPQGWTDVTLRSVEILLSSSTLQSLRDAETYVRLIDRHPDFEAQLRLVAIPQDHVLPGTESLFDERVMRDLVDLGRRLGADPDSWLDNALAPGGAESAPDIDADVAPSGDDAPADRGAHPDT